MFLWVLTHGGPNTRVLRPCWDGFGKDALGQGFIQTPWVWGGNSKYWGVQMMGVWGLCPQRGPGAEPLVRGSGGYCGKKHLYCMCVTMIGIV